MRTRLTRRFSALAAVAIALLAVPPAAAITPVSFSSFQAYSVGSRPESVAIADVTGDGRPDVLLSTSFVSGDPNNFRLFVFPQMPDGTLGTPLSYATDGANGYSMALDTGDLDGDGRADVVLATTSGIDVFYQATGGGLLPAQLVATFNEAFGAVIADVNVDGLQDIVTNTRDGVFWLKAGSSGFTTRLVTPNPQWEVEVGDLTGDGLLDIAGCSGLNQCLPTANVYQYRRSGKFRLSQYPANSNGWGACGIAVGDVTGDGRDDLTMSICANWPNARLNVFPQTRGTLGTPIVYDSYDIPEPVAVAEMNGDNLGDIVTLHGGWMKAGVYLQDAGALGPESLFDIPYASHYKPRGLAVGDINSDGKPDIAVADYTYGLVVLRQQ